MPIEVLRLRMDDCLSGLSHVSGKIHGYEHCIDLLEMEIKRYQGLITEQEGLQTAYCRVLQLVRWQLAVVVSKKKKPELGSLYSVTLRAMLINTCVL